MPKKKATAKNSARGFATTSVIKKKDDVPAKDAATDPLQTPAADAAAAGVKSGTLTPSTTTAAATSNGSSTPNTARGAGTATPPSTAAGDWDDSDETRQLEEKRELAERVKVASEKEASKVLKVLEYEKRTASVLPEFFWDDRLNLRDRVIELALEESNQHLQLTTYTESDDKLLARVASIYLILRRLGFTNDQVEACLRSVPNLELDDALDWLYLRYVPSKADGAIDEDEVKPYGKGYWPDKQLAMPERTATAPKKASTNTSKSSTRAHTPQPTAEEREAVTFSSKPATSSLLAYRTGDTDSSDDDDEADSADKRGPSSSDVTAGRAAAAAAAAGMDEDAIQNDPDSAYVSTKLRITTLQRQLGIVAGKGGKKGGKGKAKPHQALSKEKGPQELELEQLEAQLRKIQGLYLFNAKKAEATFTVERAKLDKVELAERLAGKAKERQAAAIPSAVPTVVPDGEQMTRPDSVSEAPPKPKTETTEEDTMFGDMLEDPEAAAQPETSSDAPLLNESGGIVKIREMVMPKNYTGKTPKSLLEDALRRIDKFAKATYRVISRTRAVRAVVTIRWDSGRTEQYGMEDEACETQEQAFHYVSTLALFAVANEGSLHRLLPGTYRDLWDELEQRKRTSEATLYEKQMARYRALAELRRGGALVLPGKAKASTYERSESQIPSGSNGVHAIETDDNEATFLREQLAHRQTSPSYQNMLPIRQSLPISAYRDQIVETIEKNQVVVLCGETGCGKSTQTPTMILESELSKGRPVKIYCTEPRRISAISLAQRVSEELGEPKGALGGKASYIGYNIRLESRVCATTRLTYATTGILLRMLESDTELEDVTHIIIDEVHERSIDSDFLLIILRSLLKRRKNLHVLLMSATVDAEKIADYMGGCPVINVPGRTFPVTPYFLEDAVEFSGYSLSPDSDSPYVQRMPGKRNAASNLEELPEDLDDDEANEHTQFRSGYSKQTLNTLEAMNEHMINFDLIISLLETICFANPNLQQFSSAILVFLPSLETIRKLCDLLESHPDFGTNAFYVYPLHSSISNEQQARVFNVPPRGIRKIVVSTNIAETGVTIPDVTAVIDSGRHKEMRFDEKRQISKLVECWIARSNALQRRGRAGRVQEGICFHLFTKARLETGLAEHPLPEMLRLSLQDLALRIKILNISGSGSTTSIEGILLQALDPPLIINIQRAIASLIEVKALTVNEDITQLGRHLVKLPLDVHTAKLCLLATIFGCLDAALTIAATLNTKSFFVTPFGREIEADTIKRSFKIPEEHSDFLVIYRAYKSWRKNCENGTWTAFCRKHFMSHQNLVQVEELKCQYLSNLMDAGFISKENGTTRYPRCPRVRFARIEPDLDRNSEDGEVIMACMAAAMHPKILYLDVGGVWKTLSNNAPVAIHPSSSNFIHGRRPDFGDANFITFFNIQQSKRLYVWENGVVSDKAVMLLCGDADVKLHANSASIDRKIRRYVERKSGLAIEHLRRHYEDILQSKLNAPSKPLPDDQARWFALLEEAIKSANADKEGNGKVDALALNVNVVRLG